MKDKWLQASAASGREYLIHTQFPRFIAELKDEDGPITSGLELWLGNGSDVLTNIEWIDQPEPMTDEYLTALIAEARKGLEAIDKSLGVDD